MPLSQLDIFQSGGQGGGGEGGEPTSTGGWVPSWSSPFLCGNGRIYIKSYILRSIYIL